MAEHTDWQSGEWESDGTEQLGPAFPIVTILHPMSGKGDAANAGKWHHADSNSVSAALDIVLLRRAQTRVAFGASDTPLCSSADSKVANPGSPLWDMMQVKTKQGQVIDIPLSWKQNRDRDGNHLCRGCAFASHRDQAGNLQRGICRANVQFFGMRRDEFGNETPCILRLSWTQVEELDKWVVENITSTPGRPLFSVRLLLESASYMANGNKQYQVVIKDAEHFTPGSAKRYNDILVAGRERFLDMLSRGSGPAQVEAPKNDAWAGSDDGWQEPQNDWRETNAQPPPHAQQVPIQTGWVSNTTPARADPVRLEAAQEALRQMDNLVGHGVEDLNWAFQTSPPPASTPVAPPRKPYEYVDLQEVLGLVGSEADGISPAPGFLEWAGEFLSDWGTREGGRNMAHLQAVVGAPEIATGLKGYRTQLAYWAVAHDWITPGANHQTMRQMLMDEVMRQGKAR